MAKCFSHGRVFFISWIWTDPFIKCRCFSKQEESLISLNTISYNIFEIIGSGQGSSSRLPVYSYNSDFFALFGLGPSGSEVIMEGAASVEIFMGEGLYKLLCDWYKSQSRGSLVSFMKLNDPSTTAMLLEYSSPVIPSDVEGYIVYQLIIS